MLVEDDATRNFRKLFTSLFTNHWTPIIIIKDFRDFRKINKFRREK
jgi:hypothetical protein